MREIAIIAASFHTRRIGGTTLGQELRNCTDHWRLARGSHVSDEPITSVDEPVPSVCGPASVCEPSGPERALMFALAAASPAFTLVGAPHAVRNTRIQMPAQPMHQNARLPLVGHAAGREQLWERLSTLVMNASPTPEEIAELCRDPESTGCDVEMIEALQNAAAEQPANEKPPRWSKGVHALLPQLDASCDLRLCSYPMREARMLLLRVTAN